MLMATGLIILQIGVMIYIAGGNATIWFCLGGPLVLVRAIRARLLIQSTIIAICLIGATNTIHAQAFTLKSDRYDGLSETQGAIIDLIDIMVTQEIGNPFFQSGWYSVKPTESFTSDGVDYHVFNNFPLSIVVGVDRGIIVFMGLQGMTLGTQKIIADALYSKQWLAFNLLSTNNNMEVFEYNSTKVVSRDATGYFYVATR